MQLFVINLRRAKDRRQRMLQEFQKVGLSVEFHSAVDGRQLRPGDYAQVDRHSQRRMGLKPQGDALIGNWLSQRQVMQDVVKHGPEIVAIFEDDVNLSSDLSSVLSALEGGEVSFDIVKLGRRKPNKRFIPYRQLSSGHTIGRVQYHDTGTEGYVITRDAARRFLIGTRKMTWPLDQAINNYWENGLNIYYLDPPVVHHDTLIDSQIEQDRTRARQLHRRSENPLVILCRRIPWTISRHLTRRREFMRRVREDREDL